MSSCRSCGAHIEEGTNFCQFCGTPVEHDASVGDRTPFWDEVPSASGMVASMEDPYLSSYAATQPEYTTPHANAMPPSPATPHSPAAPLAYTMSPSPAAPPFPTMPTATMPPVSNVPYGSPMAPAPPPRPPKKKSHAMMVLIIVWIVVVVGVVGTSLGINISNSGQSTNKTVATQPSKDFNHTESSSIGNTTDNSKDSSSAQSMDTSKDSSKKDSSSTSAVMSYPEGMYEVGTDLPAGEYVIVADDGYAFFQVAKDSSGSYESIITFDSIQNRTILTLTKGQYLNFSYGTMYAIDDAPALKTTDYLPAGMYKVGKDLPAGEYKVRATDNNAYYEVASDSTHNWSSELVYDVFNGEKYITLQDGQYLLMNEAELILK